LQTIDRANIRPTQTRPLPNIKLTSSSEIVARDSGAGWVSFEQM